MFEYQAGILLNLSGSGPPVTDRVLLESAATQARSLEGRPLAMHSSLILPGPLESWPRFAAAFGKQRRPMPTQEVKQGSRGVRRADTRAFGEGGRTMDFGMLVPWVVATNSLAGWVQPSRWPAVSTGFCFDSPPRHSASLLSRSATPNRTEHQRHLKE